jgi:HSP20 family molecular chaperone IbpA
MQEPQMDYIKIRFTKDVDRLSSEFEKTFEEMFRVVNPMFTLSERTWKPPMDIYETPDEIIILAEIAGVKKENLELESAVKRSGFMVIARNSPRQKTPPTGWRKSSTANLNASCFSRHPLILKWCRRPIQTVFSRSVLPNLCLTKPTKYRSQTDNSFI